MFNGSGPYLSNQSKISFHGKSGASKYILSSRHQSGRKTSSDHGCSRQQKLDQLFDARILKNMK
jgi:hypothetical protein